MSDEEQRGPVYLGMTALSAQAEKWLLSLSADRLARMARSVRGQERVVGADLYGLVQMAARSAEAIAADANFLIEDREPVEPEETEIEMSPSKIAAASLAALVKRYNELTPDKPVETFATVEIARKKVTAAEAKAQAAAKKERDAAAKKAKPAAAKKTAKPKAEPAAPKEKPAKAAAADKPANTPKPKPKPVDGDAPREGEAPRKRNYPAGRKSPGQGEGVKPLLCDYYVKATGKASELRESSQRRAVLAKIEEAGEKGTYKKALDKEFDRETGGFLQKLNEAGYITLERLKPE